MLDEGQAGSVTAPREFKHTRKRMSVTNPHSPCADALIERSTEVTAPGRHPEGGFLLPPTQREKLKATVLISTSGS